MQQKKFPQIFCLFLFLENYQFSESEAIFILFSPIFILLSFSMTHNPFLPNTPLWAPWAAAAAAADAALSKKSWVKGNMST